MVVLHILVLVMVFTFEKQKMRRKIANCKFEKCVADGASTVAKVGVGQMVRAYIYQKFFPCLH